MSVVSLVLAASLAVPALQRAMDSSAAWTMERRLAGSSRVLVSKGAVTCAAGKGIVWTVSSPFPSSVTMTTNSMVFVDEDGWREKPLGELPHYEAIRKATDAFVAGRTNAFEGVFGIRESALPDGGWRLELTPSVAAMRRLFASVEVTGAALPTNVVMKTGDGGSSVIRFKEIPRVR